MVATPPVNAIERRGVSRARFAARGSLRFPQLLRLEEVTGW